MCYWCKSCDAYVGCHNNTERPLGTMANKELRNARIKVHKLIDPLWQGGGMKRSQVYAMLTRYLGGRPYHTGDLSLEECKLIIKSLV